MSSPQQAEQLLAQGTTRNQGRTAQRMNILAAKLIGEAVRTTLGPQGMDKMIVDSIGETIITNDGATILREMNIEHPTAKMIVDIANTQEHEVGDGTTTAVVLAGELLKKAEELLDQNIHPTTIIKGYRIAADKSQVILKNMSEELTSRNEGSILKKLSMTAMTGKVAEEAKEHLSSLVVEALKQTEAKNHEELKHIKIETKIGETIAKSELIKGIVLDKEKVHNNMPTEISAAKIALIDSPLEVRNLENDTKISVSNPQEFQAFMNMEQQMLQDLVNNIVASGANVVFCQKGIDEVVQYLLAQEGIYACRRVKKSDLAQLARATGGHIITNVKDLKKEHLGKAGLVREVQVGDEAMTFIEKCKQPKAVTILVRAITNHIAAEVKRAVDDALGNVASALRAGRVVGGAGATEIEVTRNLSIYSQKLSGKEQLAVLAFAQALEVIPRTLAENAGLDPVDVIVELKNAHDKGNKWSGINVFTGKTIDAYHEGIIEPLPVKTHAFQAASDVAIMILRIDDVIVAGPANQPVGNPHEDFD